MTPEQVSALSDTELNRAMIWLYGDSLPYTIEQIQSSEPNDEGYFMRGEYKDRKGTFSMGSITYLGDYNLTMPLVIDNDIWLQPPHMPDNKWHCYDCDDIASSSNTDVLRAACECLVLIALSDK